MKRVIRIRSVIIPFFLLAIVWSACKKDSSTSSSSSTAQDDTAASLSASNSISQSAYGDVFNQVMSTSESSNLNTSITKPGGSASNGKVTEMGLQELGATVTISPNDTNSYPKTLTIDHGTGDTSADGIIRTGKLIITLSGRLIDAGSTVLVTFDQYTVAGYGLGGTYSFTNNTVLGSGLSFTTQITSGNITFPSGSSFTYSEADTLVQTAGMGTPTFTDDVYATTGNFSCASSAGNKITGTITTPLVKEMSCKNTVSGVVSFVYDNIVKGTLDFGTGDCDNLATLTIGLKTETVTLP